MRTREDHELAERMVTTKAAGQIAGVIAPTLRRLIHAGELRAYRGGKRALRVKLTDVQAFVERRQVPPGPIPSKVSTGHRETRHGAAR